MSGSIPSLRTHYHAWALVLAGGEGERLRPLTTLADGTAVPKQYCSLWDGPTLFQEALARARSVTVRERVCAVVAAAHRQWWEVPMWQLPARNTLVQPANRGTGVGVLLSLLHIQRRDPAAHVVLLPSDHHVRYESALALALCDAVAHAAANSTVTLIGMPPAHASTQLGYIVPGDADGSGGFHVAEFVEKPHSDLAHDLIERGALWNSFLIAAPLHALLQLYEARCPDILERLFEVVERDAATPVDGFAAADAYENLPTLDFSRDVLCGQTDRLRLLKAALSGVPRPALSARTGARSVVVGTSRRLWYDRRGGRMPEAKKAAAFAGEIKAQESRP